MGMVDLVTMKVSNRMRFCLCPPAVASAILAIGHKQCVECSNCALACAKMLGGFTHLSNEKDALRCHVA